MQISPNVLSNNVVQKDPELLSLANKIETQFLSEMLKAAGVGEARKAFGGGTGEDQFSSFLTNEYAAQVVNAGGLGLSESIYNALIKKEESR